MKNYTIVQRPSLKLIGIECRTSNSPEAGPYDIPNLWAKFYHENVPSQIINKTSDEIVALYCEYAGNYTQPYTCFIGCPVASLNNIPMGLSAKIIPAGSYALFCATGQHPQTLIETWGKIWESSLESARSYTVDFEMYGEKFFSGSPQEVEVYIAIKETSLNSEILLCKR